LTDLRTQLGKLPTLDPGENWEFSDEANAYKTEAHETTKTKKVRRNHVLAEATTEHPAQVEVFTEDEVVGYWVTVNFSGAIPETERLAMVDRVNKLLDAVKCARERANSKEVEKQDIAKSIFDYVLRG